GAGYRLGSDNGAAGCRSRKVSAGNPGLGGGQAILRYGAFCVDEALAVLREGRRAGVRQRQGADDKPQAQPPAHRLPPANACSPRGALKHEDLLAGNAAAALSDRLLALKAPHTLLYPACWEPLRRRDAWVEPSPAGGPR